MVVSMPLVLILFWGLLVLVMAVVALYVILRPPYGGREWLKGFFSTIGVLALAVLLILAVAFAYLYSQGSLPFQGGTATPTPTPTLTPTPVSAKA